MVDHFGPRLTTPAHFQEPRVHYIPGKGPYFEGALGALPGTQPNEKTEFKIFEIEMTEGVNELGNAIVKAIIPSDLLADLNDSSIKTTEDYLASQILKPITICVERPFPDLVPKEYFLLKEWRHFILISFKIEMMPQFDIVTLELRPILWLSTQQNNYRSFNNMNVKEIFELILKPYQEKFAEQFQVTFDFPSPPSRIQVIQMGETDFELMVRLMKPEGLSYFFYHDEKHCYLVITDKLSTALDKIEKKFSGEKAPGADSEPAPLSKPLSFKVTIGGDERGFLNQIEGSIMPLEDFKISYAAPIAESKVQSLPEYRSSTHTMITAAQEAELLSKSDGFKPAQFEFFPMSTSFNIQTQHKEEHLKNIGARFLARDLSSKLTRSARTRAYAFMHPWRTCEIDGTLDVKRFAQKIPVNYKSGITDEFRFYLCRIEHHYSRPLQTYFAIPPTSAEGFRVQVSYIPFNISMEFFDVGDDTFLPPFRMPQSLTSGGHVHKEQTRRVFSAVVVEFEEPDLEEKKEEDKSKTKVKAQKQTEKKPDDKLPSHHVPNMVCIRFPWHKPGEFVRSRVAFSWTGKEYGSLFLPEVGSEVIVMFLDGDPDYPVIVGSCYNINSPYPLDEVGILDVDGAFGARGFIFKGKTGEFVFEKVKQSPSSKDTVQVFRMATEEGNLLIKGSNITTTAGFSHIIEVTDSKSTMTMNKDMVTIEGFDGEGRVRIQKDETRVSASSKIVLNADTEIKASAGTINANSLKLPG